MSITFKTLQSDFINRSKNLTNTNLYIQEELKQIDKFLNHTDFETGRTVFGFPINKYKPQIEIIHKIYLDVKYGWSTFENAYNQYYYNEIETEFKGFAKKPDSPEEELKKLNEQYKEYHKQGLEFAKYTLWLKESIENNEVSKKKKSQLSHKQKMLALHYLGLDLSKYDNTKSAKILSQILDLNEENTRKYISYLSAGKNNVRTKSNLEKLSQLFEQQEFINISNQINNDIKKRLWLPLHLPYASS